MLISSVIAFFCAAAYEYGVETTKDNGDIDWTKVLDAGRQGALIGFGFGLIVGLCAIGAGLPTIGPALAALGEAAATLSSWGQSNFGLLSGLSLFGGLGIGEVEGLIENTSADIQED